MLLYVALDDSLPDVESTGKMIFFPLVIFPYIDEKEFTTIVEVRLDLVHGDLANPRFRIVHDLKEFGCVLMCHSYHHIATFLGQRW